MEMEAFLAEQTDKVIAVALHDLETEREIATNANEPFHPPSTIKVHVMREGAPSAATGIAGDRRVPVGDEQQRHGRRADTNHEIDRSRTG
jgi:hypothetical protein